MNQGARQIRKVTRVEELHYQSPAAATSFNYVICHSGYQVGCTAMVPRRDDRYVTVEIKDAVSPSVSAHVYQSQGSQWSRDTWFCTATDEPVKIPAGTDWLGILVVNGPCRDGTPAQATRGTAVVTFMNRL